MIVLLLVREALGRIDRLNVLNEFNPQRSHANHDTPSQVGNGNFAFNADITGLQTIKPFNTLSDYIWHTSPRRYTTAGRKNEKTADIPKCAYIPKAAK